MWIALKCKMSHEHICSIFPGQKRHGCFAQGQIDVQLHHNSKRLILTRTRATISSKVIYDEKQVMNARESDFPKFDLQCHSAVAKETVCVYVCVQNVFQ